VQSGWRDLPHHTRVLRNGLRVIAVPQPQLHRAHVGLYVRVGSRFETEVDNGLSHFLEHMLYRGTKRLRSAHEVNLAFERLGGYLYASTQADFGVFSLTLPPESLEEACDLFGEVLGEPAFHDIEVERGIVLEEILEHLDDKGRQVDADNLSRKQIYPSHPLGFTITGTAEHVRGFTKQALRRHHERHYTAATSVLVFSGAIDPKEAFSAAERAFERLPRGGPIAAEPPVHTQKRARLKIVESLASQTELRVAFRAFPENGAHRPAQDMLLRLLDDGMSSRLYHRICDDKGLCYDVGANFDGYEDDGVVDFAAGVVHENVTTVTREILELMADLAEHGPTPEELDKARKRNAWEVRSMLDSVEELGGFYAGAMLFDRFETPQERIAKNLAVTADDIRELVRAIARPERLNVLVVGTLSDMERKRLSETVRTWKGAG
jgi:predicted Zn-dependent peptidase